MFWQCPGPGGPSPAAGVVKGLNGQESPILQPPSRSDMAVPLRARSFCAAPSPPRTSRCPIDLAQLALGLEVWWLLMFLAASVLGFEETALLSRVLGRDLKRLHFESRSLATVEHTTRDSQVQSLQIPAQHALWALAITWTLAISCNESH